MVEPLMPPPDGTIKVRFKTTAEGGRRGPVVITDGFHYGCPLLIDSEYFECRLLVTNTTLELGVDYELPVKFLHPDLVMPLLAVGKPIVLWEGKEVATGHVVSVG